MDSKTLKWLAAIILSLFLMTFLGCGSTDRSRLFTIDVSNLGQLTGPFVYAAWAQDNGRTDLLQTFNTDVNNSAHLTQLSLVGPLETGDRIFITIESNQPQEPSGPRVLDGTVSGSTAILSFPRLQDFANTQGFVTVSESHRQVVTEFTNLPDVSDIRFIYQGFLLVGSSIIPLKKFNSNEVPVTDTVGFDVATARYILTIEPVPDFAPNLPYTAQPFFTNGNLVELIRQPLAKSSLTPGNPNFRFPTGIATIRD